MCSRVLTQWQVWQQEPFLCHSPNQTLVRSLGGRHLGWVLSTARMLFHDPTRSYLHILDLKIKRLCKGSTDVNTLRSHQISRIWFNTFHKHWFALVQAIAGKPKLLLQLTNLWEFTCSATDSEIMNANICQLRRCLGWLGTRTPPGAAKAARAWPAKAACRCCKIIHTYIFIIIFTYVLYIYKYIYILFIYHLYIKISWLSWPTNARPVSVTAFGWSRPAKSVFLRFR